MHYIKRRTTANRNIIIQKSTITAIIATINEISAYWNCPGYPKFPNTIESYVSLYPFVNFGPRMGFELK